MRTRNLNKRERAKILQQFNAEHSAGEFNEHEIIGSLPVSLGHEIYYHLYHRYLENMPLFRRLGKEILNHLCRLVHTCSVFKDMMVYEEGMIGSEFYFILDGEVEVGLPQSTTDRDKRDRRDRRDRK